MAVTLRRPARRATALSVVSMIDVMMILLFFFMITSSYLNLDMVPALQKSDEAPEASGAASAMPATPPATLLIRIDAKGQAQVAGQRLDAAALSALIKTRLAAEPLTPILLFPSGGADLQALISVMDTVTAAGATRVKVIRIEAQP
ncbi:biopolymer transporter ExbD [bacterium]|nr:biopolymer transporter ExbD [bacterium]